MNQKLILSVACWMMFTAFAAAQESSSSWPFTKKKPNTQTKNVALPGVGAMFAGGESNSFMRMPSPTKMMNRLEGQTDAMVQRTRSTWNGVKGFGRSLNPFPAKQAKSKKKQSMFQSLFPKKKPAGGAPATIGEFLKMPRPDF